MKSKISMVTTSEIFHDSRILNEAATLARNYQVTVLAKKYPLQLRKKFPFKIKLIDYLKLPWFQLSVFSSFFSLMKAALKENPDSYHAHDLDGLLCAFPAALLKGKILIYDSHELWSNTYPFVNLRGIQWLLPILERVLIWRIRAGITVNQSIADYLSKKYHRQFLALYNTSDISPVKKSLINLRQKFPQKKIILHLGAADEGRGLAEIISAAQFLPEKFVLIFLGGGKIESQSKILAKKLGLKNIYFFPAVAPEEITSTIAGADLGLALTQKVSLSYYLSLPNKIFQYLAAGLPILGSNFPEFKKVILNNGIGETVDPSRPKLIAQKIIAMTKTSSLEQYRQNLGLIKNKFRWSKEAKKLEDFYQKLENPAPTVSRKFKIDVFWNAASLALLGLSGIIFNIIIARFYGARGLGVFNEVYAIYILASQLAVGSVHLSVQKYIPAFPRNSRQLAKIISAGMGLTLICSLIVSTLIYFTRGIWGIWFKDQDVVLGVGLVAFGLIGFALNKTLLAVLNGFRLMRSFAFFSGLRYLFVLGFVVLLIILREPQGTLPLAFSLAEAFLFVILLVYTLRFFKFTFFLGDWLKKHLIFGYHSLLGNLLVDVNARVDILILGFFTSAQVVGIYSFAALLTDGLGQLLGIALKINVNPVLAKLSAKKDWPTLKAYIRKGIKLTYFYFFIIALVAVVLYPLIIQFFVAQSFLTSWPVFVILVAGLTLSSGYQPFQMLLVQTGHPKFYSWLIATVFITNVLLNLALVPFLGMYGSAIATAISFVVLALTLRFLTKKALKIKI